MIQIGQLQVSLDNREIRSNGESLRIGSRAFDILELLIRADGALVSKDEIMRRVWPHSVVEENNLQVHIAALRKALAGDRDLIRTVPGRGYRFVSEVKEFYGEGPKPATLVPPSRTAAYWKRFADLVISISQITLDRYSTWQSTPARITAVWRSREIEMPARSGSRLATAGSAFSFASTRLTVRWKAGSETVFSGACTTTVR